MGYSDETWYVGSSGLKYYPCVPLLSMRISSTSFAYLFWLANNKKCKYQEFCMSYSEETWYVGRSGLKYYPCVLLLPMLILSTSFTYLFWLANNKTMQISRVLSYRALIDIPQRRPTMYDVYSANIASAQAENREILVKFEL